ncbi:hypothetical protein ERW49_10340 [Aliivibrio finisterrensis]|uniref:Uncharacterized protein n=2 Tax=Aliivibrio TaxID=511678 RepID=A0A4Q5KJV5_9GAMM|nr:MULTISPECIES: hypothetical protein [Aliivibrio]MDD9191068.1 hypothetical protein [Aliivibrio sp. S2TY2]RYU46483.1 hypothetical protein ERW49_10340 [Aliivibrio finisterrensis]
MIFIICSVMSIVYMMITITYVGYINYFESASSILSYASWSCAFILLLFLIYKGRHNPNNLSKMKRCSVLFVFTVVIAAIFRIGPIGSIALVYHMVMGEKVALIAKVTQSHDHYLVNKSCRGQLQAFDHTNLRDDKLCGIGFEDWKRIEPNTPVLLIGTQSYFGVNFERYAIPPLDSREVILNQFTDLSNFVYINGSVQDINIPTKRLIYKSFD